MTRTLRLKDLESAAANASEQPFFTTKASGRNGVRGTVNAPPQAQGVIFEDDFNYAEDYDATNHNESSNSIYKQFGGILPGDWDAVSIWGLDSPESHMQITDQPPEAVFEGKSLVLRRVSKDSSWGGDKQLVKFFEDGLSEIYVSFRIKFQAGWTIESGGSSKLFRISTKDPSLTGGDLFSKLGMGMLWTWRHFGTTGMRNRVTIHPNEGNFTNPPIPQAGGNYDGERGFNSNFTSLPYDLNGDGITDNNPELVDQQTGLVIPESGYGTATHENIFGEAWHKIEFHLKLNSSPGAQDGILRQWFNDGLILENVTVPWIQNSGDPDAKFNNIRLGGNDFFHEYPASENIQEWYSIDNLIVRDSLPEDKL